MNDQEVIGHYVPGQGGTDFSPALSQSSELFRSLVADDLTSFEKHVGSLGSFNSGSWHTVLYWSAAADGQGSEPKVEAKSRTLAMLATQHGSVRVLSYLLSRGSCPTDKAKDGADCYLLMDKAHPNAASIKGMLDDAAGNWSSAGKRTGQGRQQQASQDQTAGAVDALQGSHSQASGDLSADGPADDLATATCDLTRPEYSTDWFRMYCFKVLRCSKRYAHDWRACPFAHPTENARRRDPREFTYSSLVCPDYRQGCCVRGDTCQYAHGVFESWLHPSRYRTQLCKDTAKCDRVVCFFAHSLEELRTPANSFVPPPEERLRVPEPMQAVLGIGPPAGLPQLQVPQLDTAYPSDQNHSPLELMMQQQQQQQQGLTPAQSTSALDRAASNTSFGSSSHVGGLGTGLSSGPGGQDQQVQQVPPAAAAVGSDAAPTSSSSGPLEPSPKQQQLVSPTALPVPRMSNAFARKHGLDPKEHPLVNLQRLAMQQMSPSAAAMGGTAAHGGRRSKRGGGGGGGSNGSQQGYPPPPSYSPQSQYQQPPMYQQPYPQQQYNQPPYGQQQYNQQQYGQQYLQQQYEQPAGQHPALMQSLSLQPPPQLLQPGALSPAAAAAAAAYYGSPSPMQHLQHSPAGAMLDPAAMALLFSNMSMAGGPVSSGDPTGGMGMGVASPLPGYAMGLPSPAGMPAAGLLSPMGAAGMLSPVGSAAALRGHSPLPQAVMHPASGLHSPY